MIFSGVSLLLAVAPAPAGDETASFFGEFALAKASLWPLLTSVVVAIGLFWWAQRRRRMALESLGNPVLVGRLVATVSRTRRFVSAGCAVLALAAVGFGLLRFQYGGVAKVVPASGLDVVLVVDYSKSMLAQDVYPSRSERLEAELARFIEESGQRGDRVGLVVFAGSARGVPVTSDVRLLKLFLEKADPRSENPGGTSIGRALALAKVFLLDARAASGDQATTASSGEAEQAVILLTDGEDTTSRPLELLPEFQQLGIRIYGVGIGSRSGEPVRKFDANGNEVGYQTDKDGSFIMTRLDEATLKQLAKETRGEYVHVDADRFGLDEVRGHLAELSRAQRADTVEIHREEGYAFLVVPAMLLLSGSLALGDRRRRAKEA
ncbi:MAG: VWA domain-containing protein [Myxococcales bacterium FL481]|nr:MAG: VWA domain-containing protein [Myxococcales bacterium FL481]